MDNLEDVYKWSDDVIEEYLSPGEHKKDESLMLAGMIRAIKINKEEIIENFEESFDTPEEFLDLIDDV